MSEKRLSEPLATFEEALASLRLRPSSLDPARVMYLAGQASVRGPKGMLRARRSGWLWPMATTASLLLAVTLGGILLMSPRQQTIERVVRVPVDRPPGSVAALVLESDGSPLRTGYLALRHLVLTQGIDAWRIDHGTASFEGRTLRPRDAYRGSVDSDFCG